MHEAMCGQMALWGWAPLGMRAALAVTVAAVVVGSDEEGSPKSLGQPQGREGRSHVLDVGRRPGWVASHVSPSTSSLRASVVPLPRKC